MAEIRFNKNVSTFSLTLMGLTSMIGSGWLLGTQKIVEIAGPAGILAWVIGAGVALLVGLFYAEIGSAFPSAGGIGYYSNVTHGRFCGFLTSWINWLSICAVPPIEAQSITQYLSQINSHFIGLYDLQTHNLTPTGILVALGFMLIFMFINYWSVQLFIRFNNIFTLVKICVPILTIIFLIYSGLHPTNFGTNFHEFMPYGYHSVFMSVITCGVVMSFNGFQSPLTFSEEISNPRKMLPIAIVSSILIALALYFLLQIVFIGNLNPALIAQGWSHIDFRSPYAELLILANMNLAAVIIYMGSLISPAVAGTAYTASSSRILYSLAHQKQLPSFLGLLHPKFHNPRNALILCTVIGCIFLFLSKGWYTLVAIISVLHIFSYLAAPIITIANRRLNKVLMQEKGQFKLKGAHIFAPILFCVLSILLFFVPWPLNGEMLLLVIPGLVFYFYYDRKYFKSEKFAPKLKGASWLILYFIGISLITYLGNNPTGNLLSTKVSLILLVILSLCIYVYGAFFTTYKLENESSLKNS